MIRWLALAVFPVLEAALFAAACYFLDVSRPLAFVLLFAATLCLSYSVHVSFHECVHHLKWKYSPLAYAVSIIQGLPFDGYRLHHFNHHRFVNSLDDYSTTWRSDGTANSVLLYSLNWPAGLIRSRFAIRDSLLSGEWDRRIGTLIRTEALAIGLFIVGLAVLNPAWALMYIGLVYGGWFFVSVHNYLQHPPRLPEGTTVSYYGRLYNLLTLNNGLHREHHDSPARAWDRLR